MKRYSATQLNSELFWQFPKFLSVNKKYVDLSNDDRVAYMLIKDRYRYSLSNNWVDENGEVYVYFTIEDLREMLHVGKNKVTRVKQHLIDAQLLEIVKQGFDPKTKKNKPDRFYLLQPEYDPNDLISQSSQFGTLEQSGFPKMGTRHSNEKTTAVEPIAIRENSNNPASVLEQNDFPKIGTNKDNNILDTIKDTKTDTWNFDEKKYSKSIVAQQNEDLRKHIDSVLTEDNIPMFLSKESIHLISMWFSTPQEISECISTILNAANDSRKDAIDQVGNHELHFEDYDSELKDKVTQSLRRYFNKMRTAKKGEIKNPKNYLYVTMKNLFDEWQNTIMMNNDRN